MIPYFIWVHNIDLALYVSVGLTACILLIFGYVKAILTNTGHKDAAWSALQTLCVGGLAAGVAYGVVRGINSADVFKDAGSCL